MSIIAEAPSNLTLQQPNLSVALRAPSVRSLLNVCIRSADRAPYLQQRLVLRERGCH